MSNTKSGNDWTEQLMLACGYQDENLEKEQHYWRKQAKLAPLEELELFLSTPPGKYEAQARAVMAQVYRQRSATAEKKELVKKGRIQWWRELAQKISGQVIGTLIVALIIGFITGVWFTK